MQIVGPYPSQTGSFRPSGELQTLSLTTSKEGEQELFVPDNSLILAVVVKGNTDRNGLRMEIAGANPYLFFDGINLIANKTESVAPIVHVQTGGKISLMGTYDGGGHIFYFKIIYKTIII